MNPYLISAALGLLLVSFVSGGWLGWHERSARVPGELQAQQTVDQASCAKVQQLTKDTNDEIQKSDSYIAQRSAALSVQRPTTCVRAAISTKLPSSGQQHAGQDGAGINSDWLRSYAAEAERYRTQLVICEGFLASERKLSPQ